MCLQRRSGPIGSRTCSPAIHILSCLSCSAWDALTFAVDLRRYAFLALALWSVSCSLWFCAPCSSTCGVRRGAERGMVRCTPFHLVDDNLPCVYTVFCFVSFNAH